MSTKKSTTILILIAAVLAIIFLSIFLQQAYWYCRGFTDPYYGYNLKKEWIAKPSEFLISKLTTRDPDDYGVALQVLEERKEVNAVEPIVALLSQSNKKGRKISLIYALGEIGDPRGIEPLMKIVGAGRNDKEYLEALDALSKMHYTKIYSKILELVKDDYHTSWTVDMLEKFPDRPETLRTLQKISETNPEMYIRIKAKEAINKINSRK